MEGMQARGREVDVDLGKTSRLDVQMNPSATTEAITVTASAPAALETTQLGDNFKSEEIGMLPLPRNLAGIAALAPGVNTTTFNAGQVRINGSFGYDNVYLVDGTDINDNLFGTAHNLYIEEAIDETQVMTGGISAEYGRFTGGVINVITKSGGNEFTGSGRADLRNADWIAVTDLEERRGTVHLDDISEIYSLTLGGPVLKDHLWFFVAGRQEESAEQRVLVETSIPYQFGIENPRYEVKLTGTVASRHTLQASWMDNETTQSNNIGLTGRTMDPRAFVTRTLPNDRWSLFYNGILSQNLFAEVKYSQKTFGFRNTGGTSTVIQDSPFEDINRTRHYNAPYFDSNDPEDRNNQDLTGSLAYFLSTQSTGSHDLKVGIENYVSTRTGGNSQSATGYIFFANFVRNADGTAATDSQGRYIPIFTPNTSRYFNWLPVRGATVDLTTRSYFFNDHWTPNQYFSFNLGARWEVVDGEATGGIVTVDTDRITPRLAASWDIQGDGRRKVDMTYAQYSGKFSERQFANNTNVGTPNQIIASYTGPAGQGIDFAPGFDLANYTITNAAFPLVNIRIDPNITSPVVDEWTLSGGTQIGRWGFAKMTFTNREWTDFFEDYIDPSTGVSTVELPTNPVTTRQFQNRLYSNNDESFKEYQAIQLLTQFRPISSWNINANYTHELSNHGNFIGEAGNQPGNPSQFGDYPELFTPERHYPEGRMAGFTEHRFRLLNTYALGMGGFGNLDLGLIYAYDSPQVYNHAANLTGLTPQQIALRNAAGYLSTTNPGQTIYFGELGEGEFDAIHQLDLALTYGLPVFRTLEPWIKFDVYNVLNADGLVQFDTTITANNAATDPKDALGLPTTFTRGPLYGTPTSVTTQNLAGHIQLPREYRIAAGIRF